MATAARRTDNEQEKGRVNTTKVRRYWAGKAPEWAEADEDDGQAKERIRTEGVAAPVIVKKHDDPRLRRLASSRVDRDEAIQRHREIRAAEIVSRRDHDDEESESEDESEEEDKQKEDEVDEEELQRRRQAVKERLLQQQREAEALAAQQEESESEEEEEESDDYTDSEDDDVGPGGRRLLKPIFVPKTERDTVAERERLEAEELAAAEKEKQRLAERKGETRTLVQERIALDEAAAKNALKGPAGAEEVNTDDDEDAEEEYESWKQRELRRIQRERDEKAKFEQEAEERERLKNMTEEERKEWERLNPKVPVSKDKKKWKFLQKYWHKGAYFQEDADDERATAGKAEIFTRDFSAPTGEDNFDKAMLPKVMQVRNFGRSGRTKWTHLLGEDTLQRDDAYYKEVTAVLAKRPTSSLAPGQEFAKPKKFKR